MDNLIAPIRHILSITMEYINIYQINILHCIFLILTANIVLFGGMMHLMEPRLPAFLAQTFRYGKHSHKGKQNEIVKKVEVPKSWFKHFYIFSFCWSTMALFLMLKGLILKASAPDFVLDFLDFIGGGSKREVQVNSTWALVATVLLTMQCTRRFYESNFVQVFSAKSKMNLAHYIVGFIHYFGAVTALLANTEGFVRGTTPSPFSFSKITLMQYLCIFIFHFSWSNQYKSNMILVNLRKNESGKVVSERHYIPNGGFFNMISSPHMFFELAMYNAILAMIPNCSTWYFVTIWTVTNQIANGYLTHQWYKQTFKNYPTDRYAIIPYIL